MLARTARQIAPSAILGTIVVALLLVWGGREVQAPWGETQGAAFSQAQVAAWGDESLASQVAELGCSTTVALSDRVAVKPAGSTADGVFDSGVVSVVSFNEAFAAAKAGRVFVVGWNC